MAASTVSRVGDLASSSSDAENPSMRTLLSSPCNSGEVYFEIMAIALVNKRELCFLARLSSSKGYAGWDCSKKIDCTTAASGSMGRVWWFEVSENADVDDDARSFMGEPSAINFIHVILERLYPEVSLTCRVVPDRLVSLKSKVHVIRTT
jgi:hypothetical protein